MKQILEEAAVRILREAENEAGRSRWRDPLFGYASARDPLFERLAAWVAPDHLRPGDWLPGAKSVMVFFLPFTEDIVHSNLPGRRASLEWGRAYVSTNALIEKIGHGLAAVLDQEGFRCAVPPATHNFDPDKLISRWSHRHVAYIAGLGTLGVNNMLITQKGCCGRLGSLVVDCHLLPSSRPAYEYCLGRRGLSCRACVNRCVNRSLSDAGYDRFACFTVCRENAAVLRDLGSPEICGKCLVGLPCSLSAPGPE